VDEDDDSSLIDFTREYRVGAPADIHSTDQI
jgi:hypothetical protein